MSDNIKLNKVFQDANETKLRYRILKGSAGSGKSVNLAMDYILKLSSPKYTGANLLVVRATESSHKDSTYAELCGAISRLGMDSIWKSTSNPMHLVCTTTGNEIIFRGCNDARALERVKSVTVKKGKLCWIWVEEATELLMSDFDILDDRLRGDLPNDLYYQLTLSFNPIHAQHWIKLHLWDSNDPNIFKHHSTYLDNRFIDEAYKDRMKRRAITDPEGYQVYGLGEWGNVSGNILHNFSLIDCKQDLLWYDSTVMAQDFGFNHANALGLIGYKDGDMYVIKESYWHEKYTSELIIEANKAKFPKSVIMYCDSAEPDRIKEWRQAGYRAYPVSKDKGSIHAQIDYLKQRHIYIDNSCINTYKEIQQWRWKKDPNGEYMDEPLEIYDDAMAMLRYATEPYRRNRRMRTVSKTLVI